MKYFQLFQTLLFAALVALPLSAQEGQDDPDKIGTVNMQLLLSKYYKTADLVEEFKGYEKEIVAQNETKTEAIKTLAAEARELQNEAENASLTREKQEELFNKVRARQRELQALENDRLTWLKRKRAAFGEKEKIDFGKLRSELTELVREVGDERGFDFIFDRSGVSATNVQVLAYAKDATDLTAVLIERANQDAPEEGEESEDGASEEEE